MRRFGPRPGRRRHPAPFSTGAFGFLAPPRRHRDTERALRDDPEAAPRLRREYRASLLAQAIVVGTLGVACLALVVQSVAVLRRFHTPATETLGWTLPVLVGALGLLVVRRFLRIVADYRSLRDR